VLTALVLGFAFGAQLGHLGKLCGRDLWALSQGGVDLFHIDGALARQCRDGEGRAKKCGYSDGFHDLPPSARGFLAPSRGAR
jgi:hypothetical protein